MPKFRVYGKLIKDYFIDIKAENKKEAYEKVKYLSENYFEALTEGTFKINKKTIERI